MRRLKLANGIALSLPSRVKMTTMILKRLTPNLMVKDVNRTIAFYKELLGFELNQTVPETGQFEWASMKCGDVEIMFQAESSLAKDIPALKEMRLRSNKSGPPNPP